MTQAIYFYNKSMDKRIHFSHPKAQLPVLTKTGDVCWLAWGRHKIEAGNLPLGGWARLERIQSGHWNEYFPCPVKVPALAFMEKDFEGNCAWYPLVKGQYLQGLVARYDDERRVYLVTITPTREDAIHQQWPKIIQC